ncbi:MAG TPA: RecX family transcriptional regulator [Anaerolineae bacterium]|nr:RecX family transcriptional regulator [Anaerolineae bacterium]
MSGSITALRYQKRDRERVSVYVDGRFAFGVPDIVAAGLRVGQVLSDDQFKELAERGETEQAYNSALGYLSYRPRSRRELATYLRKRGAEEDQVEAVVQRLEDAGLLGDEEFARFWVENRERFRPRGPAALRHELRTKGVDGEAIEAALESLDTVDGAYRAAARKAQQLQGTDRPTFFRKLVEYLARRGFEYEVAKGTAERYWRELSTG